MNPSVAHERRDINVFQISAFGVGLALGFIIVVFAMWAMFDYLYKYESAKNANNPNATMMNQRTKPPEPRLQPEPGEAPDRASSRVIWRAGRRRRARQLRLGGPEQRHCKNSHRSGDRYDHAEAGFKTHAGGHAGWRSAGDSRGLQQRKNARKDRTMKFQQYISVSVLALAVSAVLYAQTSPFPQAANSGATMNTGRPAPVPDLLNMKGGDRPSPLKKKSSNRAAPRHPKAAARCDIPRRDRAHGETGRLFRQAACSADPGLLRLPDALWLTCRFLERHGGAGG